MRNKQFQKANNVFMFLSFKNEKKLENHPKYVFLHLAINIIYRFIQYCYHLYI